MRAVRRLARSLLELPARVLSRRSLARKKLQPPRERVAVNYGGVLAAGTFVAGGKVKLLHLRERFPESADFNVLYLVSSSPPRFAEDLVAWAKRHGAKLVWNQNGVGFPAWAADWTAEINEPMARLRREASHVVYQSEFCRESAERWLGPAACVSSVLLNPVDLAEFSPALEPPPLDCWKLLVAGTHHQSSRVLGAIWALGRIREAGHNARLLVAGAMRWHRDAERQARAAADKCGCGEFVSFHPAFTQAEAVQLYRGSHVLLHLKYHDPCPTVVIEALSCGVPVIGSRSGGMPELVGADGGELIDVPLSWDEPAFPEPEQVADAVVRIMSNWPERSIQARSRAWHHFDADAWVEQHAQLFEAMIQR